jgi:hypothetical protein
MDFLSSVIYECKFNIHCDRIYPALYCLIGVVAHHNHNSNIWQMIKFPLDDNFLSTDITSNEKMKLHLLIKLQNSNIFEPVTWHYLTLMVNNYYYDKLLNYKKNETYHNNEEDFYYNFFLIINEMVKILPINLENRALQILITIILIQEPIKIIVKNYILNISEEDFLALYKKISMLKIKKKKHEYFPEELSLLKLHVTHYIYIYIYLYHTNYNFFLIRFDLFY